MYYVEFVSPITKEVFKTGRYQTKNQIRKAETRYSHQYGAYLSLRIKDEAGKALNIWEVR